MSMDGGSDSDAPEELTATEGIQQYEELTEIQTKNAIRVARESKERRRKWGKRHTRTKPHKDDVLEVTETEEPEKESTMPEMLPSEDEPTIPGMLPSSIVELLAAREKKTFSSDSEEEIVNHKPASKKKKQKTTGPHQTVLLKEIPPSQCLQNSLEFLKRRKMQVARSSSVLKHSKALRQLS